ncbi:SDR family NAD(P)-dependent oxidoreductase [Kineococcus sp. SYSU DK006]|uniref:SDR family NAD(P)-dependent oxidoreductase n=1 Tax=Kineococcus sp. SYSU DK006 TaxID=3383127 RepID=UPI003D7ED156
MSETWPASVVLTGATSGIGLAAARLLAARVQTLVLHGPEPAEQVHEQVQRLRQGARAQVHYVQADFTSLRQVTAAAHRIADLVGGPDGGLDALVNNAGVPGARTRQLTADGFERTWQVNHLSPTLLTRLLLPVMGRGSRIVNVGSTTHRMATLSLDDPDLEHGYDPVRAYARSKLAIVAGSAELARRLEERGIDVVSISPGVISTSLLHAMFDTGGADVEHGARRLVEALVRPVRSGSYVDDGRVVQASAEARDPAVQERLARLTERQLERVTRTTPAGAPA